MTVTCYLCGKPITGKVYEVPLPRVGSYAYVCSDCVRKGAKNASDYPTIEWVRDYLRDHPGSTAPQIAEAWYPAEVQQDRYAWQMAKDKVRRRIGRLCQWGMAERVNTLAGRGEHATYRTKEVDY